MEDQKKQSNQPETQPEIKKDNPPSLGRPSDYGPSILIKAMEYVANYEEFGDVVPSIEGLAVHLGVTRKTIYNWAEDQEKQDFLYIFEICQAKQGRELINKGLNGKFSAAVSKMMLSKHGYVEKTESDLTSKGESLNGLNQAQKEKLDAILNGTKPTTTEQGSSEDSNKRDEGPTPVSNQ